MNIILREIDRLRVQNWNSDVFADLDSPDMNGQEVIGFQFYEMHNLQLRSKDGSVKMFVIPKGRSASDVDFGYYEDAEIIWEFFKHKKEPDD